MQVTLAYQRCLPFTGSRCQSQGLCRLLEHPITRLPGFYHNQFLWWWATQVNVIWTITEVFSLPRELWIGAYFIALGSGWWYPPKEPGRCFRCSERLAWFRERLTKCESCPVAGQQQVRVLDFVTILKCFKHENLSMSLKNILITFSTVDIFYCCWFFTINCSWISFFFPMVALYQAVSCAMVSQKQERPVRREPCQDRSTAESTKGGTPPMFTLEMLHFSSLLKFSLIEGLLCKKLLPTGVSSL